MKKVFEEIKKFHGHIGPYAVLGYRMGLIANQKLGDGPFEKNTIVWTDTEPPLSCLVDGIQISSGCTLGKGSIKIQKDIDNLKAEFSNKKGEKILIMIKSAIRKEIDENVTEENIKLYSEDFIQRSDSELFKIKKLNVL
jgi:formylmethanofuran dehydrogenase subunit E